VEFDARRHLRAVGGILAEEVARQIYGAPDAVVAGALRPSGRAAAPARLTAALSSTRPAGAGAPLAERFRFPRLRHRIVENERPERYRASARASYEAAMTPFAGRRGTARRARDPAVR
jgi:hypothetical protein